MTVRWALYQEEGDLCTLMRAHPHNVLLKQKTYNLADKPHRHTAALMYMYVHSGPKGAWRLFNTSGKKEWQEGYRKLHLPTSEVWLSVSKHGYAHARAHEKTTHPKLSQQPVSSLGPAPAQENKGPHLQSPRQPPPRNVSKHTKHSSAHHHICYLSPCEIRQEDGSLYRVRGYKLSQNCKDQLQRTQESIIRRRAHKAEHKPTTEEGESPQLVLSTQEAGHID